MAQALQLGLAGLGCTLPFPPPSRTFRCAAASRRCTAPTACLPAPPTLPLPLYTRPPQGVPEAGAAEFVERWIEQHAGDAADSLAKPAIIKEFGAAVRRRRRGLGAAAEAADGLLHVAHVQAASRRFALLHPRTPCPTEQPTAQRTPLYESILQTALTAMVAGRTAPGGIKGAAYWQGWVEVRRRRRRGPARGSARWQLRAPAARHPCPARCCPPCPRRCVQGTTAPEWTLAPGGRWGILTSDPAFDVVEDFAASAATLQDPAFTCPTGKPLLLPVYPTPLDCPPGCARGAGSCRLGPGVGRRLQAGSGSAGLRSRVLACRRLLTAAALLPPPGPPPPSFEGPDCDIDVNECLRGLDDCGGARRGGAGGRGRWGCSSVSAGLVQRRCLPLNPPSPLAPLPARQRGVHQRGGLLPLRLLAHLHRRRPHVHAGGGGAGGAARPVHH